MAGEPTKFGTKTLADALNEANPNEIADALGQTDLGTMLAPLKITVSGATSAAAQNITTLPASVVTVNQGHPSSSTDPGVVVPGPNGGLPPILSVVALRVVAGTLAAGPAVVTDSGGTPTAIGTGSVHVVTLSDDGKTLTFQAAVTGFVLEYIPRPTVDPSTQFIPSTKA